MYAAQFPNAEMNSPEWLQGNAESHKGKSAWNKGLTKQDDARVAGYADSLKGQPKSESHCKAISRAKKGKEFALAGWNKGQAMRFKPERGQAISNALKGRVITWGDKISQARKEEMAADPGRRPQLLAYLRDGHSKKPKPNKPERKLIGILDRHFPNQWKYVGNWAMTIDGVNPDFVNIDGKRQIIEVYGEWWHREDNPQDRIDRFCKYGYATIVFWQKELKDEEAVVSRIANFPSVETLHELSSNKEDKDKVQSYPKG